ncbi:MAG: tRNA (adenosine(37)-N6)-dimethylallyltransferase MiaA [Clostridia bacterium]|nr:tRNA (adenosine(37)-N6)-dimethylallyltransferase MiaA [Clostridia bacterium]MDD4386204.1 tRNA (adenosine(37)-N6)-dimethylallyltransferase MiaA [Clostridia bacterium]
MNDVICIVGPTASGKTSLSIELAKIIDGEIISADSMQIYKDLNIGTAKVTEEEMQGITHHMIDIISLNSDFSVADFKKICYEKIDDIIKRGRVPIIVGGTGLYISSVILDMNFEEQEIDQKYRDMLYKLAENFSNEYVYNMLREVDEKSANEIHPNNLKRVIRALEMYKSNKTKSEHMEEEKERINNTQIKYKFKLFCLKLDKEILNERINKRVDKMIQEGLEDEAKIVYKLPNCTAKQAVGYKEFFEYFENKIDLNKVIEDIKLKTRQYAKRQMTWFKKMPNLIYLDATNTKDKIIEEIMVNIYEK